MPRQINVTVGSVTPPAPAGFTDTFDYTANPIGNGWTQIGGNVVVANGSAATGASGFSHGGAQRDLGAANGTITAELSGDTSGLTGLVFRYTDASNYWRLIDGRLTKVVAGTESGEIIGSLRRVGTVDLVLSGSNITVRLASGATDTVVDSFNSTATRHGISVFHSVTFMDSFSFVGA